MIFQPPGPPGPAGASTGGGSSIEIGSGMGGDGPLLVRPLHIFFWIMTLCVPKYSIKDILFVDIGTRKKEVR